MENKEEIIIDGVDVSQCKFYVCYDLDKFPHRCYLHKDMFGLPLYCDIATCCKNCYYKQLKRKEQALNAILELAEENKNVCQYQGICKSILDIIKQVKENNQ